ncbi:methionine ABC transporter permease [Latilactobacillus fuchuensis]|uniref:Methionine ABC transporter, permease component n=1 Tax=Latilactobacillus fuchuensis TaxID=164393 RepID=A0A2N9DW19_9LACO|nr:methionine ABC transporter permease [Latilactobacillus fuchuensis]SPC38737.1 methionine ABC transporter, permease component [Latilactobacillus fuchuensis]
MTNVNGFQSYFQFNQVDWATMWQATFETVWLSAMSVILVAVLGFLLGLMLYQTGQSQRPMSRLLNGIVALCVNVFRSIPFIILIVLLIPLTKGIMGTMIGPKAAIPALIISAAPFYARLVELAFHEVDGGVLEATRSMGASKWQLVWQVLLPESLPALVSGLTVTAISLIGYTAMAGVIGAGGLGNLAYQDGFQANQNTITLVATVIILIIVFICQKTGDLVVKRIDHR